MTDTLPPTDNQIVFEDPPPMKRGRGLTSRFESLRAPLTARPGEWAQVPGLFGPGTHSSIQHVLGAGFETTAEPDDQGRRCIRLWVRYVGTVPS